MDGEVRSLTGTIDGEKAQAVHRHVVEVVIRMAVSSPECFDAAYGEIGWCTASSSLKGISMLGCHLNAMSHVWGSL